MADGIVQGARAAAHPRSEPASAAEAHGPRPKPKARRAPLGDHAIRGISVASVVGGLIFWELLGRFVISNTLFLATPLQALAELWTMAQSGELQIHILVSGQEFLYGFFIASAAGILIGLLIASFRPVNAILSPWVAGLYATPIIAVAPLVILWFGIGIWSKVVVVISVVIFPVIINTEAGVRAADKALIEAVRSFGASRLQIFTKVSLPSALPFILAGLRLGVGRGLIGVVVGELFGARAGIGFMILQAAESFNMPRLFAGVAVLAVAGITLMALCRVAEQWLVPWNNR
jgi:NitT/TauT family transport system permease protein